MPHSESFYEEKATKSKQPPPPQRVLTPSCKRRDNHGVKIKTCKRAKRKHAPVPQDPSETTPRGEQHNKKIARGENQKEDQEAAATIEDKEAVCANVDEAATADIPRGLDAKAQKRKKEPKRKTRQQNKRHREEEQRKAQKENEKGCEETERESDDAERQRQDERDNRDRRKKEHCTQKTHKATKT